MNKKIATTAVLALAAALLSGCGTLATKSLGVPTFAERSKPRVVLVGGEIDKSRLSLVFFPREFGSGEPIDITWQAPEGARFPANGIEINGKVLDQLVQGGVALDAKQQDLVCPRQEGGATFTCRLTSRGPAVYKYTVRVRQGDREIKIDPPITVATGDY